jgi:5-methylcytosine-specific restriction endonuclease McrA
MKRISEVLRDLMADGRLRPGPKDRVCQACGGSGFIICVVTREGGYNDYHGSREILIDPDSILNRWNEICSVCYGRGRMRYTSDGRAVPSGKPVVETRPGRRVDYRTYILSDEWQARADAAKERADWRCQVCNRPSRDIPLHAHHRTYERLGNERPEDITVLCRDCHDLYEKNRKGQRR